MTEDLAKGASDALGVNPPEEAPDKQSGEPAKPMPEVEELQKQLAAQSKQFDELRSVKDKEMTELRQGLEARDASMKATVDAMGRATLSTEEYAKIPQPIDPTQEAIWRKGNVMYYGRQGPDPLPYDVLERLATEGYIRDAETLQSRLTQERAALFTQRMQEAAEKSQKEHLEEVKKLLQQSEDVKTKAAEEISQTRKETGADAISSGGPSGQSPSAELRRRLEDEWKELLVSEGDKRVKTRDLFARYKRDGFDPDKEEWYKATR